MPGLDGFVLLKIMILNKVSGCKYVLSVVIRLKKSSGEVAK